MKPVNAPIRTWLNRVRRIVSRPTHVNEPITPRWVPEDTRGVQLEFVFKAEKAADLRQELAA